MTPFTPRPAAFTASTSGEYPPAAKVFGPTANPMAPASPTFQAAHMFTARPAPHAFGALKNPPAGPPPRLTPLATPGFPTVLSRSLRTEMFFTVPIPSELAVLRSVCSASPRLPRFRLLLLRLMQAPTERSRQN